ncbi:MAG TPA: M1 family metallopeptidase [Thermoplasmata archaeon]|nr:M1 family metallopeptidase [Thermoplasmata archaeon]
MKSDTDSPATVPDLHYDVDLSVGFRSGEFRGSVEVEVDDPGPDFRLNVVELDVRSTAVDGSLVDAPVDLASESIRLPPLGPGRHRIRVEFAGHALEGGLTGLYRSNYGDGRTILTTQMYPNGTRRLFPCVDEPTAKGVFRMAVAVDEPVGVIFNTPAETDEARGTGRWVRFAPTPKMSPYLIYLGIGPFELREETKDGVQIVVAAPPGRTDAGSVALDVARRSLLGYEEYYRLPYPLRKLHLVAVPAFWAGAMENWGAIAFRETALLVDPTTDPFLRRYIVSTIVHEVAHQWFGNLVTMRWWDDFWLNESFATFVGYALCDRLYPGADWWGDFLQRETGTGLVQDALTTTHPIQVEVHHPSEIAEIADRISYGKGASVLRMVEAYIGEEAFRRGVTEYLTRFQYANARGEDLWNALEGASRKPVARVMERWIRQPGHPVIEVAREDGHLRLRQTSFVIGRPPTAELWPVPVRVGDGPRAQEVLLDGAEASLSFPPGEVPLVNPSRTGFYHVRYRGDLGPEMRARVPKLDAIDQWGFLSDEFLFFLDGSTSASAYRETLGQLSESGHYLPVRSAVTQLIGLRPYLGDRSPWGRAATSFLTAQLDRVGLDPVPGEPETTDVIRSLATYARDLWDPAFAASMGARFEEWERTPGSLRNAVAIGRVLSGGAAGFDDVRARLDRAASDEEAEVLAEALAFAPGGPEMERALALLDSGSLASSRVWDVLRDAGRVASTRRQIWEWFVERADRLEKQWTGTGLLAVLFPTFIPLFGYERPEMVREYFAAHDFAEAHRGVDEGLEWLRVFLAVRARPDS